MDTNKLREQLKIDEGVKYEVYKDHLGYPTFGIGHLVVEGDDEYGQEVGTPVSEERVSIFSINGSSEDSVVECKGIITHPCYATTDETGSFEVGPIVPGAYIAEIDLDDDGFSELSQIFLFRKKLMNSFKILFHVF